MTGAMTTDQYILKVNSIVKTLEKENLPLARAAEDAHAAIRSRIFPSSGGSKDIKERNVSQGVGFKGKRDGDYSKSYAAFRKKKGRQINAANLQFKGNLMRGFRLKKVSNTEWQSAPVNEEVAAGLEDIYNKNIFGIGKKERAIFHKTASAEYFKMFTK